MKKTKVISKTTIDSKKLNDKKAFQEIMLVICYVCFDAEVIIKRNYKKSNQTYQMFRVEQITYQHEIIFRDTLDFEKAIEIPKKPMDKREYVAHLLQNFKNNLSKFNIEIVEKNYKRNGMIRTKHLIMKEMNMFDIFRCLKDDIQIIGKELFDELILNNNDERIKKAFILNKNILQNINWKNEITKYFIDEMMIESQLYSEQQKFKIFQEMKIENKIYMENVVSKNFISFHPETVFKRYCSE